MRDFNGRVLNFAHHAMAGRLRVAQVVQDVLGHDDSAVDDDPEVDGPQRQQVRRIPPGAHGRGPRLFGGSYPYCFQRITIW